jgi:hypothetical protein
MALYVDLIIFVDKIENSHVHSKAAAAALNV